MLFFAVLDFFVVLCAVLFLLVVFWGDEVAALGADSVASLSASALMGDAASHSESAPASQRAAELREECATDFIDPLYASFGWTQQTQRGAVIFLAKSGYKRVMLDRFGPDLTDQLH